MSDAAEISTPVRAIIADDHPLVLLAIENLMSGYPNMEIVGRAADADELFLEAGRTPCDLVLMDLYMPGEINVSGLDAVRQFKATFPKIALIVLTMENEAAALQKVISLGVDALVSKRDRLDLIHVAVVTALARECYIGPTVRTLIASATVAQRLDFVRQMLSRRELEVFTQYASGLGVTEIAARLGRSVKTISAQKCTAMRKLELNSDAELFRFAVEHGVVSEGRPQSR
ncbi:response regulator transcription factor [Paraburkholderia sp. BCC1884]|uniref:response regulator transcription factor n=1 Tax=Paraburkholderia sp. BCC1884 TaxID=2562668 RepID=UPI001181E646|nr:response regulator transcription factor [Paraburkholderia sp. BCC1884]